MKRFVLLILCSVLLISLGLCTTPALLAAPKTSSSPEQTMRKGDVDIIKQFLQRMHTKRYVDARKLMDREAINPGMLLKLGKAIPANSSIGYKDYDTCCGITRRIYKATASGRSYIIVVASRRLLLIFDYDKYGDSGFDVLECGGPCLPEAVLKQLPYSTNHFLACMEDGRLAIHLTVTLNNPDQIESARKEEAQYKKEAKAWLVKNGVDLRYAEIDWVGD